MKNQMSFTPKEINIISTTEFTYHGVLYEAEEKDLIILYDIIKNERLDSVVFNAEAVDTNQ